jgi:hypothetical protein
MPLPIIKRARSLWFLLLLFSPEVATLAHAGTYTAASCDYSDVNAVINGPTHIALNGDIINIPSGTCTWTSQLTVPSGIGITISGSGTPNSGSGSVGAATPTTEIIDNVESDFMITASPFYGQTMRISMMAIDPESSSTALTTPIFLGGVKSCSSSGCANVRVDNITFGLNTQWTEGGNGSSAAWMVRTSNVFGVIDHVTLASGSDVNLANVNFGSYLGVGSYGDNSWAQPDSFGTANNLFLENNLFYSASYFSLNDCDIADSLMDVGGCRVVLRYNTMYVQNGFGIFENHGTETTGRPRSGREVEVYNNTIYCQSATGGCSSIDGGLRGGTGRFFDNHAIFTTGAWGTVWLGISLYRTVFAASPWGACGGSASWDQNDGRVYYSGTTSTPGTTLTDFTKGWRINQFIPRGNPYSVYDITQGFWAEIASNTATTITVQDPISESGWMGFKTGDSYEILRASICVDQPGRGAGTYISGTTPSPTGWVGEVLDPIYQWGDTATNGNVNNPMESGSGKVIPNRDFYPQASGIQTSPTSPFNGTSGTGWGTLANRPTTCTPNVGYAEYTSGGAFVQLDECTATNTWTNGIYTSYAYPHPLDSNGGTTSPSPTTNLKAVAQ